MATEMKQFGSTITKLINKENLGREEAKAVFYDIIGNETTDMHQGAFLAALTAKGETAEEIAGSWDAIYHLDTVKVNPDVAGPIVDNCGTGMDSFKSFNISTAASLVAAAEGVTIARHGARALSSVCGTVDILEELGVKVDCTPEETKEHIEELGIGLFNGMSPLVHPQALGRILSQISFGTVLNISASLANPALPTYAVRGVYSPELLELVPQIMKEIGYKRALVIYGAVDEEQGLGMDEASVIGRTQVAELMEDGSVKRYSFYPADLGIQVGDPEDLRPLGDRTKEAERMRRILSGQGTTTESDVVSLNAGLIFYLTNKAESIEAGYRMASKTLASGKALTLLEHWAGYKSQA